MLALFLKFLNSYFLFSPFCVTISTDPFLEVAQLNRKVLALLLALALLAAIIPGPATAVSDVCFVAINDTLPEAIPLAYVRNSIAYVPCSALSNFRIYNMYDSNAAMALIYTSSQQITIDINAGVATDKDGMTYSATALFRNGQVYVPAAFICSKFGLRASYIEGVGEGDICRITDGTEILDDDLFLSAATNLMRTRYNSYQQSIAPPPTPTPTEIPEPQGNSTIYLTFLGLPTAYLLNLLKNYGFTATFFLTSADIVNAPETVRRIVGNGHNVGFYCETADLWQVPETAELLFEAAHIKTVLAAGNGTSQEFIQACLENDLVPCQYDINGIAGQNGLEISAMSIISRLNNARGNKILMLNLTKDNDTTVRAIMTHLYTNADNFGVTTVREVGYTGGSDHVR